MEKIALNLKNWIRKKPREFLILFIILFTGAALRLYRIDAYMTFLGDEGRDAIIVRNLLVNFDPILIGPGTSIGSMYLGPLYYYFMAPFLFLSNFSPIGPAIGVAFLGVATIALVYVISKKWFSVKAAYIAAGLYAISPTVIIFSRSSWNPNIMPFFALLSIYSIWAVWKEQKFKWLIVLGVSFAFVLQSHYLGLLLLPPLGVLYLLTWRDLRGSVDMKNFMRQSLFGFLAFALLMSPLVIFDFRHNFLNSQAVYKFFTVRQETVSIKPWNAIPKLPQMAGEVATSLLAAKNTDLGKATVWIFTALSVFVLVFRKKLNAISMSGFLTIFFWIFTALVGFGIYKQHIYDHYFGFLFPAPFILLGGFIYAAGKLSNKFINTLLLLLSLVFAYASFVNSPLRLEPNRQMNRARMVAEKVSQESNGNNFNIAVLAERNYEDGYQYFLEKEGDKIVEIDAQREDTVTDQLFVICEINGSTLTEKTCDPTHSPKAEVAGFGWSEIEAQWEVDGVIIYKLGHSKSVLPDKK
jgi:4-amino-4-deoxy-L-arabinose transferase-like glycosyltransferase